MFSMSEQTAVPSRTRVEALDSLRGLASLSVCVHHSIAIFVIGTGPAFWNTDPLDVPLWLWPNRLLDIILSPFTAVIFFFVLSGYVLGRSLSSAFDIREFAIRRFFRLAPPFVFSIFLCWLVIGRFVDIKPGEVFSQFSIDMFGQPKTWGDVWRNLILHRTAANPVTWTIAVEAWGSVFLPAILFLNSRINPWIMLGVLFCLPLASHQWGLSYLYCFAAGAMIASRPLPSMKAGTLFAVAAVLLVSQSLWPAGLTWLRDGIITLGSALLIVAVLKRPVAFLSGGPLIFLGRISYSLYLLHLPALYLTLHLAMRLGLSGLAGGWFLIIGSLLLAIPIAWLSYRVIELPSIWAGKRLSRITAGSRPSALTNEMASGSSQLTNGLSGANHLAKKMGAAVSIV